MLATRKDNIDHSVYKRQANFESTTTEIPTTTPGDEPVVKNLVYVAKDKALLYTTIVPILKIRGNKSSDDVTYNLDKHALVTADERDDLLRLVIKFIVPDKTVRYDYEFNYSSRYFDNLFFYVFLDSYKVCVPKKNFRLVLERS